MKRYKFLTWLDSFAQLMASRSNMDQESQQVSDNERKEGEEEEDEVTDDEIAVKENDQELSDRDMEEIGEDNGGTPKPCKQVKVKQKPKKTTKPSSTTTKRTAQGANMDEIEMEVIKSLKKDISIHQKNANPNQDPDDLFASDLAADIRLLPLR